MISVFIRPSPVENDMDEAFDSSNACYPSVESDDIRATASCDPEQWGIPAREHDRKCNVRVGENS